MYAQFGTVDTFFVGHGGALSVICLAARKTIYVRLQCVYGPLTNRGAHAGEVHGSCGAVKNGLIARFIWLKNGLTCPQFWQGLTRFPQ